MQWDDRADLKLYLLILRAQGPDLKVNCESLARAFGQGVTPEAVKHRVGRIRAKGDAGSG
ncbi:hypothetical protein DFH27DRAFT_558385 [Peziza echinospora]|nr:hypothetical protein DFH27DRAFT_558385 [Peziza echinospora]